MKIYLGIAAFVVAQFIAPRTFMVSGESCGVPNAHVTNGIHAVDFMPMIWRYPNLADAECVQAIPKSTIIGKIGNFLFGKTQS